MFCYQEVFRDPAIGCLLLVADSEWLSRAAGGCIALHEEWPLGKLLCPSLITLGTPLQMTPLVMLSYL
jgi:hypothetical protein